MGFRTTSAYDELGQQKALVDANDHRTTFLYDEAGQNTVKIDPLDRRPTFTYNEHGHRKSRHDARDNRTTYAYDSLGRETGRLFSDQTRFTFSYNEIGNRKTMVDITGTTTYTHDPADRVATATNPAGKCITYAYNEVGQRDHIVDPDGDRFTYAFDEVGRSDWLQNPYGERTTFVYDNAGRLLTKSLANGTRATHIYDEAGRVTRVANLRSDDAVLSQFDYSHDNVGNRTGVVESDAARVSWTYDDSYRLVQEHRTGGTTVGWDDLTVDGWDALTADQWDTMQVSVAYNITHTYDPLGNRLVKIEDGARTTCTYDEANQLATSQSETGVTTFTYDATGNQHLQESPSGDRTTYTWNIDNRLTKAELPAGVINTMTYTPDGLRVEKQDSTGVTRSIWDGQNILTETDASDTTQAVYTLHPQLYGNLISQRRASDSRYHHHDALGSVVGLSDALEALTDTYAYQAYGHPDSTTGNTENSFRWIGEVGYMRDSDTGLYYVRARHYDPVAGLFISEDPIGFAGGDANVYRYVGSKPTRVVDPAGLVGLESYFWTSLYAGLVICDAYQSHFAESAIRGMEVFDLRGCKNKCKLVRAPAPNSIAAVACNAQGRPEVRNFSPLMENSATHFSAYPGEQIEKLKTRLRDRLRCGVSECTKEHEEHHIAQIEHLCPGLCGGKETAGMYVQFTTSACVVKTECYAHIKHFACLYRKLDEALKPSRYGKLRDNLLKREGDKDCIDVVKDEFVAKLRDVINLQCHGSPDIKMPKLPALLVEYVKGPEFPRDLQEVRGRLFRVFEKFE